MEGNHSLITNLITTDLDDFNRHFSLRYNLGCGTDGVVTAYYHRRTALLIAVKYPRPGRPQNDLAIRREARALARLESHGKHKNIAHMLAYRPEFGETFIPVLFSLTAPFGDLHAYREMWREQEYRGGREYGVKEIGVWKLFRDLVLALEWLHNECGFVHRDVKSANVLVFRSWQWVEHGIPTVPLFKLCDFSRAEQWPAVDGKVHAWAGTVDYAPPLRERSKNQPAIPAGDMWALGATIQEFALGISPLQSRKTVVALMDKFELPHPKLNGQNALWKMPEWLNRFSAAYRPLNLSSSALQDCYDDDRVVSRAYVPFSDELQDWYKKLFERVYLLRATSAELAEELVPLIDGYINGYFADKMNSKPTDERLEASSHHQEGYRSGAAAGTDDKGVPNRAPSYDGNDCDYSPLSP